MLPLQMLLQPIHSLIPLDGQFPATTPWPHSQLTLFTSYPAEEINQKSYLPLQDANPLHTYRSDYCPNPCSLLPWKKCAGEPSPPLLLRHATPQILLSLSYISNSPFPGHYLIHVCIETGSTISRIKKKIFF